MNQRLVREAAEGLARRLLSTVENCLREEEKHLAFTEFYELAVEAIESYEEASLRLQRQLSPMKSRANSEENGA